MVIFHCYSALHPLFMFTPKMCVSTPSKKQPLHTQGNWFRTDFNMGLETRYNYWMFYMKQL